jgi:hypothetical protein
MQHAIARQAEAERERRAKIINAEGEAQAAAKLAEAADVIGLNPVTVQLRYLQTLREIGGSQNSTIVFPMPIDLMRPMVEAISGAARVASDSPTEGAPALESPSQTPADGRGELEPPARTPGELDASTALGLEPPPQSAEAAAQPATGDTSTS